MNRPDSEIRRKAENFTFYLIEYASMISRAFTEVILSEFVRDRTKYIYFLDYFEKTTFQNRKKLVKIILESNYNDIFQKYPCIFNEIDNVQEWRNKLAHYTKHYELNSDNSYSFVLYHPIIKNQIRLSEEDMKKHLSNAEKCKDIFYEILQNVLKLQQTNKS